MADGLPLGAPRANARHPQDIPPSLGDAALVNLCACICLPSVQHQDNEFLLGLIRDRLAAPEDHHPLLKKLADLARRYADAMQEPNSRDANIERGSLHLQLCGAVREALRWRAFEALARLQPEETP